MQNRDRRLGDLRAILRSGNFADFVNQAEDSAFECKASPYRLDEDVQQFELVKDVAAFANSGGGLLVIGLKTEKVPERAADTVKDPRPFLPELFKAERYRSIIEANVFPRIQGLAIEWFPARDHPDKGLASIYVPPQSELQQPFLANKFIDYNGKVRGVALGYFERHRDGIDCKDAREFHYLIRAGRTHNEIASRLDSIEQKLPERAVEMPDTAAIPIVAPPNEIDRVISLASLQSRPAYVLRTQHLGPVSIPDMFASQRPPVRELLEKPPQLRPGGFDIEAGTNARVVEGKLWRTLDTEAHRLLELWRNGTLIFSAPADKDYLSWGKRPAPPLLINPIVLLESLYLFCELARRVQEHTIPKNCGVLLQVELRGMDKDQRLHFVSGPVDGYSWRYAGGERAAPSATAYFEVQWVQGAIDPARLAYEAATKVYEWFGLTHDQIPYITGDDSQRRVDTKVIANF